MPVVVKTRLRAKELPCFSTIPTSPKPFFKQWFIYIIDIVRILDLTHAEAREVMLELRSFYGKANREPITVDEFCTFIDISKNIVRMHLVSRVMEKELNRQVRKTSTSVQIL